MKENQRQYTIPLRKYFVNTPKYKRSKKAISLIKEFIKKHMKTEEVKLGKHLNEYVWRNGIKNPPGKVRVLATKKDKEVTVELEGYDYKVQKVQTEATPEKPTGLKGKLQETTKSLREAQSEEEGEEKPEEEAKPEEKKQPKKKESDKSKKTGKKATPKKTSKSKESKDSKKTKK